MTTTTISTKIINASGNDRGLATPGAAYKYIVTAYKKRFTGYSSQQSLRDELWEFPVKRFFTFRGLQPNFLRYSKLSGALAVLPQERLTLKITPKKKAKRMPRSLQTPLKKKSGYIGE